LTPSAIYGSPSTPFVAEFVGTMNRLEATVLDTETGEVDHGGVRLTVDAARGRRHGERVLVLVRPELLELSANGAGGANTLTGEVLTHTFLGPVTRLKILAPGSELIADIPTARVESLPIGLRVVARIPSEGTRLLTLEPDGQGPADQ
jgi:putative spermidine/putrescine transport system ATP-binding protein